MRGNPQSVLGCSGADIRRGSWITATDGSIDSPYWDATLSASTLSRSETPGASWRSRYTCHRGEDRIAGAAGGDGVAPDGYTQDPLLIASSGSPEARSPEPGDLSPREREVAELLCLGHTNAEISDILHLSVRTVEHHRSRVFRKLDVRSRAGLVKALRRETNPA